MDDTAAATASKVAKIVHHADAILAVTGAGISVDSGLPTYRGTGGMYTDRDTDDGMPIEEALSGQVLKRRPDISWKHLWVLGEALQGTSPNRGHEVLVEMERAMPASWVLTQNVDGFHAEAGSRNLIEIHGRRDRLSCMSCDRPHRLSELVASGRAAPPHPPTCLACDGILRPGVVLFGEMLPDDEYNKLIQLATIPFGMVMSIGTSSQFPYIQAPMVWARDLGIPTVEINMDDTPVTEIATYRMRCGATEALDAIWEMAQ